MALIYFNNVVFIHVPEQALEGYYRVVATSLEQGTAGLVQIGALDAERKIPGRRGPGLSYVNVVPLVMLEQFESEGYLRSIEIVGLKTPSHISRAAEEIKERRLEIMGDFFDHEILKQALLQKKGLAIFVRDIASRNKCSRENVYKLFRLLCLNGFESSSLIPHFHRSGGPGKPRPWVEQNSKPGRKSVRLKMTGEEEFIQHGLSIEESQKIVELYLELKGPKKTDTDVYEEILEIMYATRSKVGKKGVEWTLPKRGTYPNKGQFNHLIRHRVHKLTKLKLGTTELHYQANHRALKGVAWQNISGPGHIVACDSTTADVQLRSAVDRRWKIGRPTLYVLVDVWSTAVVGFYLCYEPPSWAMAKLGLFCSCADPGVVASLWDSPKQLILSPAPKMFDTLFADRGEYLSKGERITADYIKFNEAISPSRRADLRAVNEVKHRIIKSIQYRMLPGAMDACRKETELKKAPVKEATLTIYEYARYLFDLFNRMNHASTLKKRLTTEMIKDGVHPSPAGLWKWGHEIVVGYRREMPFKELVTRLLPTGQATVNKHGVMFNQLQYESEWTHKEEWTGDARNHGAKQITVHYFPGSIAQIWYLGGPSGLTTFKLSAAARAPGNMDFKDWEVCLNRSNLDNRSRDAEYTEQGLEFRKSTRALVDQAKKKNKVAGQIDKGKQPHFKDVQKAEIASLKPQESPPPEPDFPVEEIDPTLELIQDLLNKKIGPAS